MARYKQEEPQEREFTVPAGEYECEVVSAEEDVSEGARTRGADLIKLKCRVVNGDGSLGVSFYERLIFHPNTSWKVDQYRASCGEEVVAGEEVDVEADDQIGKRFTAILSVKEHNGRKNNEISSFVVPKKDF